MAIRPVAQSNYDHVSDMVHDGSGILAYTLLNIALSFAPIPEEGKQAVRDGACRFSREICRPTVKSIEECAIKPIFESRVNTDLPPTH